MSTTSTTPLTEREKPVSPPTVKSIREEANKAFTLFVNIIFIANRPLPIRYGDGKDTAALENVWPWVFGDVWAIGHGWATEIIDDFMALWKAGALMESLCTLMLIMIQKIKGGLLDDKRMLLERIIRLTSRLPTTSKLRVSLTAQQVSELWDSLPHPPLSRVGKDFDYRKADGGGNNIIFPNGLGCAGSPYARSVKPMTKMLDPPPDADLLFERLFSRGLDGENFTEHPNKISSMLIYTAAIITHDLFRTGKDKNTADTSSYLDLSPLYGANQEEQDTMRTLHDGRIKPDCFPEKRLLPFPPGAGVLLIMFGRFHNHVAQELKERNEGGRFTLNDDEDLFQTARLVTCGLYVSIVMNDYLRTIINLNRVKTTWTLNPRLEASKAASGVGNMVSVEFNLIYRWHSCISQRDDKWIRDKYNKLFPGKDIDKLTIMDFATTMQALDDSLPLDPSMREFNGLQRNSNGYFEDDDLVKILTESVEDVAGAFGARNVPHILRIVEILGIKQSRWWKVASLNEYRKFFNLKPYATFEDINSDPQIANTLRQFYPHPDAVELYPGLVTEGNKKPMVPGVGLCPPYTVSRAILSDAVTLVRGDRHYTTDYSAGALTSWGLHEASSDSGVLDGCVAYKLILNAFPNHFKSNSIYAAYPFTIPEENRKIQTGLGSVSDFDFDPPNFTRTRIISSNTTKVTTMEVCSDDII